jgi:segregation and condensation protein A
VAEQAALLAERLAVLGSATFATLTADCAGPLEVVARFLAVLDLFRNAAVELEQPEAFGELTVRWTPDDRS